MPMVTVQMYEGRSDEVKAKMIKEISCVVAETSGAPLEQVWIVLSEVPKKHWGMGGVPGA
ncbi:2-hydroxymuconate tautomerase family protein [archaeon]|nr:2-hydroxymuconate tautomerase family protein [archaeon]